MIFVNLLLLPQISHFYRKFYFQAWKAKLIMIYFCINMHSSSVSTIDSNYIMDKPNMEVHQFDIKTIKVICRRIAKKMIEQCQHKGDIYDQREWLKLWFRVLTDDAILQSIYNTNTQYRHFFLNQTIVMPKQKRQRSNSVSEGRRQYEQQANSQGAGKSRESTNKKLINVALGNSFTITRNK